jgi:hypothetical protein
LSITVIIGIVAGKTERIALCHLDMAKSLEAIGLFIEMGTVAIEVGTGMTEMNITMQNGSIVITVLIVMQIVRVNQIDALVLRALCPFYGLCASEQRIVNSE